MVKGELLKRLEYLSKTSEYEANLVEFGFKNKQEDCIYLNELYTERKIENEILTNIKNEKKFILIVGEAGHGKTSLLWHLSNTLKNQGAATWFIKSSIFFKSNENHIEQALRSLIFSYPYDISKKHIILFDTLDLVLHNDEDREKISILLQDLITQNINIVATCRPLEAIKLKQLSPTKIQLNEFDDDEFSVAVEKYAARYENRSTNRSAKERISQLTQAVARGLPVEQVCRNPLTLRMLFEIYSPYEVSDEINVFRLYREYWSHRVERDLRAGDEKTSLSENLESSTEAIALIMFMEGSPELERFLIEKHIEKLGGKKEDITTLIERGILRYSYKNCSFFHQTFFEHSAAHGLLKKLKSDAIVYLEDLLKERPDDLFRAPVIEQTLLLAEDESDFNIRNAANTSLNHLLSFDNIIISISGIYVYGNRRKVSPELSEKLKLLLIEKEYQFCFQLMRIASWRNENRLDELFVELGVIWNKNNEWRLKETLLNLLERLTVRTPERVLIFLRSFKVADYLLPILQEDRDHKSYAAKGINLLLRIYSILNKNYQNIKDDLFYIYEKVFSRNGSDDLSARILYTIASNINNISSEDKTYIFKIKPPFENTKSNENWHKAVGFFLEKYWKKTNQPSLQLLNNLQGSPPIFHLGFFNALALLLSTKSSNQLAQAFDFFLGESNQSIIFCWRITWERLLVQKTGNVSELLYDRIAYVFSEHATKKSESSLVNHSLVLQEAIINAKLNKLELNNLLAKSNLNDSSLWTSNDLFGKLLVDAFLADFDIAINVIYNYLKDAKSVNIRMPNIIRSGIADHAQSDKTIPLAFINILIRDEDNTRLLRVIESLASQNVKGLSNCTESLNNYYKSLIRSSSKIKRTDGYRIWIWLLENDLEEKLSIDYLKEILKTEKEISALCIAIKGLRFLKPDYKDTTEIFNIMEDLSAPSKPRELRKNSLVTLVQFFRKNTNRLNADNVKKLQKLLVQDPIVIEAMYEAGYILNELAQKEPNIAEDFFFQLVNFIGSDAKLGNQALKRIEHLWRNPVRNLFINLPLESQKVFLKTIEGLNPQIKRLVINSIYETESINNTALSEIFISWLNNPNIEDEVKNVLRQKKYHHARHIDNRECWNLFERLNN